MSHLSLFVGAACSQPPESDVEARELVVRFLPLARSAPDVNGITEGDDGDNKAEAGQGEVVRS